MCARNEEYNVSSCRYKERGVDEKRPRKHDTAADMGNGTVQLQSIMNRHWISMRELFKNNLGLLLMHAGKSVLPVLLSAKRLQENGTSVGSFDVGTAERG